MAGRNFIPRRNRIQHTNQNPDQNVDQNADQNTEQNPFLQTDSITQRSLDLLVNNIFARHGADTQKPKLSAREKQELQSLLRDLQASVENLTKHNKE
ncbi:hypothetical protein [Neobacillus terrae]|uniref:hypothetical protein n=1 Tax=Neobacillus terrae TaxID=3034837 RepID=UPI0014072DD2|nr:hypothetical protein [Neobacillus terrae]NHM33799.1 hypothetical protein [Neobacillus terrae]